MEPNAEPMNELKQGRDRVIVRTSALGIGANVLLAAFKAAVGLAANSIAVVLDAVNNLSDALSSVITIIGTKLAGRKPDKKHPLGYGRIEYLSAMIVAAIVLYAGITSLVESVKKIIAPEAADYSVTALIIIAVAVAVKLVLGRYVKSVGNRVRSGALVASGSDAMFDSILSASVLGSALIFLWTGVSLEAYVGVVIAGFIIKAGIEMLIDTLDEILGKRADRELLAAIRKTICQDESITGAFDLILHSYGPEQTIGSVHVEVPDTMTADEIDLMERRTAERVYREHGVILAGIGIYARNTRDDRLAAVRSRVTHIVMAHEGVLQIHGFYLDEEHKRMNFDVILDFALDDRKAVYRAICDEVRSAYPEYEVCITLDIDI